MDKKETKSEKKSEKEDVVVLETKTKGESTDNTSRNVLIIVGAIVAVILLCCISCVCCSVASSFLGYDDYGYTDYYYRY